MNDPYSVLGISQNASDGDVKKAYRELARKYHPDNYHDNPLADLAQEKMKEINEAYNTILRSRENGGTGSNQNGGFNDRNGFNPGGGYSAPRGSAEGNRVRTAINSGDIGYAEELLAQYPVRNAEWNFLMGSVCYRKGWLDDAMNYFRNAVSMEPGNSEYNQALAYMRQGGAAAYNPYGRSTPSTGQCDACDICSAMLCLNMCCRCG